MMWARLGTIAAGLFVAGPEAPAGGASGRVSAARATISDAEALRMVLNLCFRRFSRHRKWPLEELAVGAFCVYTPPALQQMRVNFAAVVWE